MHYLRRQEFEPLCTRGGDYYACAPTQFVGCCAANPCVAGGSCGSNSLKPMSFDRDSYSNAFKDQACSTGAWYTCIGTTPPFVGCCKSNPCTTTSGCPDGDLDEGSLSSNPDDARQWLSVAKLDSATTTSLAAQESSSSAETASSGSATTTSLAAQQSSSSAETASSGHTMSCGAIYGVTVGAIAVVILFIFLFLFRRKIAAPTESKITEKPSTGKNKAPSGGNAPSDVHVREGPVIEVAPKEVRSSGNTGDSLLEDPSPSHVVLTRCTDLPTPSPTSVYSPYIEQNPYSPPRNNRVSEVETPASNFQNRQQNASHQSVELP